MDLSDIDLQEVIEALDCLTTNERTVIEQYYGLNGPPQTFIKIAKSIGLAHSRTAQIRNKALRKIRQRLRAMKAIESVGPI